MKREPVEIIPVAKQIEGSGIVAPPRRQEVDVEGSIHRAEQPTSESDVALDTPHQRDIPRNRDVVERDRLIRELRDGADIETIIRQLNLLRDYQESREDEENATDRNQRAYEFDHSWKQEDVDLILDNLELSARSVEEDARYGVGGFLPWFLTTRQGKEGEKRPGISEQVINWVIQRVEENKEMCETFQHSLGTYCNNIHMVPLDKIMALIQKGKNHPGSLSSYFRSELMGYLALSSSNGYYTDRFQEMATRKGATFDETIAAINSLITFRSRKDWVGFEETGDHATRALQKIYKKRREYFVRLLIRKELTPPLEDQDVSYKKAVLLQEGIDVRGDDNAVIEEKFRDFIYDNYEFCQWSARQQQLALIKQAGYENYDYGTFGDGSYRERARSARLRRSRESQAYGKLAPEYGIQYVSNDSFRIFKIDSQYEKELSDRVENFGQTDEVNIEFYATKLRRCFSAGNIKGCLPYLHGIGLLSENRRLPLLKQIRASIPEPLLARAPLSERERFAIDHADEVSPLLVKLQDQKVQSAIIETLEGTTHEMRQVAEKRYFGYQSLNIDGLDFFLSFIDQSPKNTHPPHHTFYYYAYIRKVLPVDLVKEFEARTGLTIPPAISDVEIYDDFLKLSPRLLSATFDGIRHEDLEWFRNQLVRLANAIKETLPETEPISIKEYFVANAIPKEKLSDEFIANYRTLMDLRIRSEIESKIGFSVAELDVRAQIAFLEFLSRVDESEFGRISQFLLKQDPDDRVAIASAYLAFQHEPDFTYIIERVCRHNDIGLPLIRGIYKLIGNVNKIRVFMEEEFSKGPDKKLIPKIHDALIKKAYDLLLNYNRKVADLEVMQEADSGDEMMADYLLEDWEDLSPEEKKMFPMDSWNRPSTEGRASDSYAREITEEIGREITNQSHTLVMLLNCIKTMKENGEPVTPDDIVNSRFQESVPGPAIPETTKQEMRFMYAENFKKNPEKQKKLLREFDEALQSSHSRFYIFHYQDKLLAFVRFDERGKGVRFAASFNVDPKARGMKLGEMMMESAVDKEAADNILEAYADSMKDITCRYLETGFVATKAYGAEGGDINFVIIRDDRRNHYFKSKDFETWPKERIKKLAPLGKVEGLKFEITTNPKAHPFVPLQEGYYLTRYIKEGGQWFLVYEKPQATSSANSRPSVDAKEGAESTTSQDS